MKARRGFRDQRGMASFAMFLFAVVSVLILLANFRLNYAVSATSDGYDAFASETVEKNGLAQLVKESILAVRETAIANSANPVETEIGNRLASMTFPGDVAVALASSPAGGVPANPFFPFGAPAASAQPDFLHDTGSTRPLAGMGVLLGSLACAGPCGDLGYASGPLLFTFSRTSASSPADNQTYTVRADLLSVPLTNVDVVAYGLPATGTAGSGSIPPAAPAVPAGFFGSDVSRLVVSSNNPAYDPTATPDLFASSGAELLPYQYRDAVSFSWNAYEYLWSAGYQNALLAAAALNGAIYNFASPPAQPIPGVTVSGNALTVDCSAVTGSLLAVVDPDGVGSVTLQGSAPAGAPFVLLVRNTTADPARQTAVVFAGNNNRPAIFYLENSHASFTGSPAPQIQGALFLDQTCSASGSVTWFGHLSFYGSNSPLPTLGITMVDSPSVKAALADLAPRVLLVSASAAR